MGTVDKTTTPNPPAPDQTKDDDLRDTLLEAAERLEGLARRLARKQDFLSEWTVRSIAWELAMLVNRPVMALVERPEPAPAGILSPRNG